MKSFVLTLSVLLFYSFFVFAADNASIADMFPKASEMRGGTSMWIVSGISSEKRGRCSVHENTYAYYSPDKKEKILDIERSNTYVVSARIFDCDNLGAAFDMYKELSALSKKHAKKNQSASVPFGEQGIMVALPPKNKSSKSQHADFYITYIFRNFIVQVYSDDGFAEMDMASDIEKRIHKYLEKKGLNYAVNKINLKVSVNDEEYIDSLAFTGDKIAAVLINGAVLDANNRPVAGAVITALETSQKTETDKQGRFKLNVSAGKGKSISMNKVIFLPFSSYGADELISTGFYPVSVFNNDKESFSGLINILVKNNKISGKLTDEKTYKQYPLSGSINGDKITLDADCSHKGSAIKCRMAFAGSADGNSLIKGKVYGMGGGNFVIDKQKLAVITENKYLRDAGVSLKLAVIDNGTVKYSSQNNLVLNAGKNKSYIELMTNSAGVPDSVYFKDGFLKLSVMGVNINKTAELMLYEKEIGKKGVTLKKIAPLKTLSQSDSDTVHIDISSQLRHPSPAGYMIGLNGADGDFIVFNGNQAGLDLNYYRDASSYRPHSVLEARLKTFSGADIVSNKGYVENDGENDIVLTLAVSAKGRVLEQLEVTADADRKRVWNTIRNDIYPSIGVMQGDEVINGDDSGISVRLDKDTEFYELYLYKGSLEEKNVKSFTVKAVIDGKTYETIYDIR